MNKYKVEKLLMHMLDEFLGYEARSVLTETDRGKELILDLADKYSGLVINEVNEK